MINIDVLKKELQIAADKVNKGYEMSDYEKKEFVSSYEFLFDLGVLDFDLLVMRNRIVFSIEKHIEALEKCKEFSSNIMGRLSEILFNIDIDKNLLDGKCVYNYDDLVMGVLKFYKDFDQEHYGVIRDLIFDKERFQIIPYALISCYDIDRRGGCSTNFNNNAYVYVQTGKCNYPSSLGPFQMYAKMATIHELGHVINFQFGNKHQTFETVFREAIPYIAQQSYLSTSENEQEASKEYFLTLKSLARDIEVLSEDNHKSNDERYYYYIVGVSIGLYLSCLYTKDHIKFRYYYNLIKENLYINEEKIIALLLNDEDFLRMNYLKEDIIKNKNVLLKS